METDLQLLSRYHGQGDTEAFQSLVRAYAGMVHATAVRVTRDSVLAQDIAQETFLALARSSGAAIQSVGAWLHHVAWQKARDRVRGESRRRRYEGAAAEHMQQPGDEATWTELEPMLDKAMDELPSEVRAVLIARFFRGQTQQEIANAMDLSQSKVSRVLDHGIAALRQRLRSHGVICGTGLAALMSAHGVQAAPAALVSNLGKLALTGVGAATLKVGLTQTLITAIMTPTGKLISAATAAVLVVGALGNHLASRSSLPSPSTTRAPAVLPAQSLESAPSTGKPTSTALVSVTGPSVGQPSDAAKSSAAYASPRSIKGPSPELLGKLSALKRREDFKAFVLRLFASKDPTRIAAELREHMGIDVSPQVVAGRLIHPNVLEVAIVTELAAQHPEEALAWLSMFEGSTNLMAMSIYRQIFEKNPEITAQSIASTLPEGVNREQVMSVLRAQSDPLTEASRVLTMTADAKARQNGLWQLANLWPIGRATEGLNWAMSHLQGQELNAFVPELVEQFSKAAPDETIAFMSRINDEELLARCVAESLTGIVGTHQRPGALLPLISKLDGEERNYALTNLAKDWVRIDQETLTQWLNTIESPADFDAALPSTLPQLTRENYQRAISSIMKQLDPDLEAALIKSAMPNYPQSTPVTIDIISRLTALPQYRDIGPGRSANQDLLWQAVNQNAAGWVSKQGALPADGARWIDSLPFRTPTDKTVVAAKLYDQWKLSDPTSAAQWAQAAGVNVR